MTMPDYRPCFPFSEIRDEQHQAIEFALDAFLKQDKRFVVLELGTGVGKSAIGVTIAKHLAEHGGKTLDTEGEETSGAYVLTTQKILQQQYVNDFGPTSGRNAIRSLKSANNYQCRFYLDQTCAESKRLLKQLGKQLEGSEFLKCCRGSCPYTLDKQEFIEFPLGITNFSYFLAETMYAKQLVPRALMVIDECVRGDAKVWVEDNLEVNMREVFDNHAITHVMSFNEETSQYERRRITRRVRTSYTAETQWIDIHVNIAGVQSIIRVTGNHKIWTKNRGMVRADELTLEDVVKLDVLPKKDVTRKFIAIRAGKASAIHRRSQSVSCDTCGRTFTAAGLKQHRASIVEVRECLGDGCSSMIEITKTSGNLKRHCSHECYSNSPATRVNRSQHMTEHNPMCMPGVAAKAALSWKRNWNDVRSEESKQEQLTRFKNAPLHENRKGPNKLEQQVIDIRLPGVQFTGLGEKWVTFRNGKHKNPDFVIEGTHKVIEVGDVSHWHTLDEIEDVKRFYDEIGYECLYVTNDDFLSRHEQTVALIKKFVCNHDVSITKLVKLQKPRNFDNEAEHFKYNIEVEGNHNYFVNSVLVSNCHNIENELGKFVEVTFSERFARSFLGCRVPKLDTAEAVVDWIKNAYSKAVQKQIRSIKKKLSDHFASNGNTAINDLSKRYEMLDKHICKVNRFIETYTPDNWVMNVTRPTPGEPRGGRKFEFKPVDVASYGESHLYRFGSRVLLMSATVVDKDTFCKSVGIDITKTAFLHIASPFPAKNRPIHYLGVGSMSQSSIDSTLPHVTQVVQQLLELHKNEKGIVHCIEGSMLVDMADGSKKQIDAVSVGDEVLTWDGKGSFEHRSVIATYDNGLKECVELTLDNGQSLVCTSDHLVLTTNRGYVAAGDLNEDDDVLGRV